MKTEIITHSSAMQKSKRKTNVVLRSMCVYCFHVLSLLVLSTWKVFCWVFFLLFNTDKSKCNKMQIVLAIFLAVQEMDLLTVCVADVGL